MGAQCFNKENNQWQKEGVQETQSWGQLPTEDKHLLEMIHMRREIPGEEKEAEWKITQNLIHKGLEHVTSVSEAKGHGKEFQHP